MADIGASKKRNFFFLRTFHETFKGKIYAINPGLEKIGEFPDVEVYNRITEIPQTEQVDFAFIEVPRDKVVSVVEDCILKGVKLVAIFTANFADEHTEEGQKAQDELIKISRGKIRIIGPNGMGLYYPRLGIRWRASLPIVIGKTGIVAQSGGLCNLMIHGLTSENVGISKAFSIGNAIDINVLDVLNYYKEDPETDLLAAYVEGLPNNAGKKLIEIMSETNKPIVILKGGRSEIGSRAAVSHTASLVGSFQIWQNALKQAGGLLVETFEDLVDTMKYLKMVGMRKMENICLASLSGGYGVICSDTLAEHKLNMPYFKEGSVIRERLSKLFTERGTSYNNPIDLAVTIYDPPKLEQIFRIILDESNIDGIIFEIAALYLVYSMKANINLSEELFKVLNNIKKDYRKPILVIIQDIGYREAQSALKDKLQSIDIPVYSDILHIARVLKRLNQAIEAKQKRVNFLKKV